MKTLIAAAFGLASLGSASPVSAFHFLPKESDFVAMGAFDIAIDTASFSCQATFHGTTVGRGASITSATLSGADCPMLVASNLPWKLTIEGGRSLKFHDVTFSGGDFGVCGPGQLKGRDNAHGKITITDDNLPGPGAPCAITATLTTNPDLTIGGN